MLAITFIHLHQDVHRFGSLDNFSAFPFENFYQVLGKLIRKGEKPLQQAAKWYSELEANGFMLTNVKPQSKSFRGLGRPSHGILLESCINPQYHSYTLPGGYTVSTLSDRDNCCKLDNGEVMLVENFASNREGETVVIGRKFLTSEDAFTFLCKSSVFVILYVKRQSELKMWPASEIVRKCFRMPWKNGFIVEPLHKRD